MKTKKKNPKQPLFPRGVTFEPYLLSLRISLTKAELFLLIHKTDPEKWTKDDVKLLGLIVADRTAQKIINKNGITFKE